MGNTLLKAGGVTLLFCFLACENHQPNTTVEEKKDTLSETKEEIKRYYQIPSPDEMFAFIRQSGMLYKKELLLESDLSDKIVNPLHQTLAFGIYTADLAYTAAFEEYQTTIKYFATVRKMADKIGVASAFDEALVSRIQNNLNNADSLVHITNDSYFTVVEYLEQNERGNLLALMALGGWLESVYIVSSSVDLQKTDNPVVQRLIDQKETLGNIMEYMQKYADDEKIKAALEMVTPLKEKFDAFESGAGEVKVEKKEGKLVIGASSDTRQADPQQLKDLKESILAIRKTIVTVQ